MKNVFLLAVALVSSGAVAEDNIYTIKKGDWYLHRNIHGQNYATLYTTGNSQITRLAYRCSRELEYAEMKYKGFSQRRLYVNTTYRLDNDLYGQFVSSHDHKAKLVTAEVMLRPTTIEALDNAKTLTVHVGIHEGKTSKFSLAGFSELYIEYRTICDSLNPKVKVM